MNEQWLQEAEDTLIRLVANIPSGVAQGFVQISGFADSKGRRGSRRDRHT